MIDVLQVGLPQSLDAERFVLGAILRRQELFSVVASIVDAADFSIEKHRRVFQAMTRLYADGKFIDGVTVGQDLLQQKHLESVGGLSGITDLDDGLGDVFSVEEYCRIVKEKSILRRAIQSLQLSMGEFLEASEDSGALLERAERVLRDLGAEKEPAGGLVAVGDRIREIGVETLLSPRKRPAILWPWNKLNEIVYGMRAGQFILIAARPGMGKTSVAVQVAEHVTEVQQKPVGLYSLEMSAEELIQRMACSRANVDSHRFRQGYASKAENERLYVATSEINELPLYIDDRAGRTVTSIHAGLRKMKARHSVELAIIDYLQLIESEGKAENRNQEITRISRKLKLIAKDLEIPVIALAQLNRANETEKRPPVVSDLRDSGSLEQDADVIVLLYQPEANQPGVYQQFLRSKIHHRQTTQRTAGHGGDDVQLSLVPLRGRRPADSREDGMTENRLWIADVSRMKAERGEVWTAQDHEHLLRSMAAVDHMISELMAVAEGRTALATQAANDASNQSSKPANEDREALAARASRFRDAFEGFWLSYRKHYAHESDCSCRGCVDVRELLASDDKTILSELKTRVRKDFANEVEKHFAGRNRGYMLVEIEVLRRFAEDPSFVESPAPAGAGKEAR